MGTRAPRDSCATPRVRPAGWFVAGYSSASQGASESVGSVARFVAALSPPTSRAPSEVSGSRSPSLAPTGAGPPTGKLSRRFSATRSEARARLALQRAPPRPPPHRSPIRSNAGHVGGNRQTIPHADYDDRGPQSSFRPGPPRRRTAAADPSGPPGPDHGYACRSASRCRLCDQADRNAALGDHRLRINSPDGKFTGPPHQAADDGVVTATYHSADATAGIYTVIAKGNRGTGAQANFRVDAYSPSPTATTP